jgi:hypothetical protein
MRARPRAAASGVIAAGVAQIETPVSSSLIYDSSGRAKPGSRARKQDCFSARSFHRLRRSVRKADSDFKPHIVACRNFLEMSPFGLNKNVPMCDSQLSDQCNSIRERECLKVNACGLLGLSRWSTGTSNTLTSPKGHSTSRHNLKGTFPLSFDSPIL